MKLYQVTLLTIRHGDPTYYFVAESKEQAKQRALEEWGGYYTECFVREVNEIDGYKIVFKKGKKISLEQ